MINELGKALKQLWEDGFYRFNEHETTVEKGEEDVIFTWIEDILEGEQYTFEIDRQEKTVAVLP